MAHRGSALGLVLFLSWATVASGQAPGPSSAVIVAGDGTVIGPLLGVDSTLPGGLSSSALYGLTSIIVGGEVGLMGVDMAFGTLQTVNLYYTSSDCTGAPLVATGDFLGNRPETWYVESNDDLYRVREDTLPGQVMTHSNRGPAPDTCETSDLQIPSIATESALIGVSGFYPGSYRIVLDTQGQLAPSVPAVGPLGLAILASALAALAFVVLHRRGGLARRA